MPWRRRAGTIKKSSWKADFLFSRVKQSVSNEELIERVVTSKYASNMKGKGNAYL